MSKNSQNRIERNCPNITWGIYRIGIDEERLIPASYDHMNRTVEEIQKSNKRYHILHEHYQRHRIPGYNFCQLGHRIEFVGDSAMPFVRIELGRIKEFFDSYRKITSPTQETLTRERNIRKWVFGDAIVRKNFQLIQKHLALFMSNKLIIPDLEVYSFRFFLHDSIIPPSSSEINLVGRVALW